MSLTFRTLTADEIDCRVQSVTDKGCIVLLYKDARCDMRILDEEVGAFGWQREHSRDNANCTVSIWDNEKQIWIKKEDTGVESNTEKEKGLASDSFKRACFNWGIGRELYSSPFIFILTQTEKDPKTGRYNLKNRYEKFTVSEIGYNAKREINKLIIVDGGRNVRYQMGKQTTPTETVKQPTVETNQNDTDIIVALQEINEAKTIDGLKEVCERWADFNTKNAEFMAEKAKRYKQLKTV